mgnify:CR=1 FL=1
MIYTITDSSGNKMGSYDGDNEIGKVYDKDGNYLGKYGEHEIFNKDGMSRGYYNGSPEEALKTLLLRG